MEKNIKDYIHLYLGCRVILKFDLEKFKGSNYDEGTWYLDIDLLHAFYKDESMSLTPILYPLKYMTEAHVSAMYKLPEYEKFYFLLSKHYDLFGLIEAGYARSI